MAIYVTQPYLPPLEEFIPYLEQIWDSKILTNGGPFHQQLEAELCAHLGVKHISLFANGTLALVTALQALGIQGEVITTPYSFVATSNALLWNGITPVFTDIAENSFNLDPAKIEAAITPKTQAILPVHCYGYPCDTRAIQRIADQYGLKVIYDAAHAFGVEDAGGSIVRHGNLSILSFHATKVFNTFEGGAIVSSDIKTKQHIDNLKNFGFRNETTVIEAGINSKMNELQAAIGLLQLKNLTQALTQRQRLDALYRTLLADISGIHIPPPSTAVHHNYGYFPILVEDNFPLSRDALYQALRDDDIYSRRYFYPLISDFPMYSNLPSAKPKNLPFATDIAQKVICLPIYPTLETTELERICSKIRHACAQTRVMR